MIRSRSSLESCCLGALLSYSRRLLSAPWSGALSYAGQSTSHRILAAIKCGSGGVAGRRSRNTGGFKDRLIPFILDSILGAALRRSPAANGAPKVWPQVKWRETGIRARMELGGAREPDKFVPDR